MNIIYEIRPICGKEWLPDRCMATGIPLHIRDSSPQYGCPGFLFGNPGIRNRIDFEDFYRNVLNRFSGCGFVAWEKGAVIGYTNFFPHGIAQKIKFYGWGEAEDEQPDTLVHHCVSIVQNPDYRHKGIGGNLLRHSLEWAKANKWRRYEVHHVLPDNEKGIADNQKSVLSFWRKLGFSISGEEEADNDTREYYGVNTRYSLALDLDSF